MIITFYSFKGGVGRSQLLVNLANYFYSYKGQKILLIDWDLEAPGLHHYFEKDGDAKHSDEKKELQFENGLLEYFEDFLTTMKGHAKVGARNWTNQSIPSESKFENGGRLEEEMNVLVSEEELPSLASNKYISNIKKGAKKARIDLLPGGNYEKRYYERLNQFNWNEFYERYDGKIFIEIFKDQLKNLDYDYIFIDSRTGFSDYQGICNIQMPDFNVVVAAPSKQNFRGCVKSIERIKKSPYNITYKELPLIIMPILSRLDRTDTESGEWIRKFRNAFSDTIIDLLNHLLIKDKVEKDYPNIEELKDKYIENILLEYKTRISYGEKLLFRDSSKKIEITTLERQFKEIAEIIEDLKQRKKGFSGTAKSNFSEFLSHKIKPIPKFLTTLPRANQVNVIGREKDLKQLHLKLTEAQTPLLLNGLAGIGKTSLAKYYLEEYESDYDHIAWLNVGAENPGKQGVIKAFLSAPGLYDKLIGQKLKDEETREKQHKAILDAMENLTGKNLLVIDSAEDITDDIKNLLPHPQRWRIIITTRCLIPEFERHTLNELSKTEAKKLLFVLCPRTVNAEEEKVEELLKLANYHPLTIKLLAARLRLDYSLDISQLVDRMANRQTDPAVSSDEGEDNHDKAVQGVYEGLYKAFEVADLGQEEMKVLQNFSVIPPIEMEFGLLVRLFLIPSQKKEMFVDTLNQLVRQGWLIYNEVLNSFYCQQLIQMVIRYKLKPDADACENLINFITNELELKENYNRLEKRYWMTCAEHLLAYITDNIEIVGTLWLKLGIMYEDFANFPKALDSYKKAKEITKSFENGQEGIKQEVEQHIASVMRKMKEIETAVNDHEAKLENAVHKFGENSSEVVRQQVHLAKIYKQLGRFGETRELLDKVKKSISKYEMEGLLLSNHIQIELSDLYLNMGDIDQAKTLLGSVFQDNMEALKDDIDRAIGLNFKMVEQHVKKREETKAREHLKKILRYQPKDLVTCLEFWMKAANHFFDLHAYEDALDVLLKALKLALDKLEEKEKDPIVFQIRLKLANVYIVLDDVENAKQIISQILKVEKKLYGENHPKISQTMARLAHLNKIQASYLPAKDLYEETIKIIEKSFDTIQQETGIAQSGLGKANQALGNYGTAKESLVNALELNEHLFGKDHPRVGRNKRDLGKLYIDMSLDGKKKEEIKELYQKALKEFEEALAIFNKELPAGSPEIEDINKRIDWVKILIKQNN